MQNVIPLRTSVGRVKGVMPFVKCNQCGRIYYEVSREFAIEDTGVYRTEFPSYEFCDCGNVYKDFSTVNFKEVSESTQVRSIISRYE